MKLYLAGPMQGVAYFNFPLFNEIAARLEGAGHEVFNPAARDIARHGGVDISNPTGDPHIAMAEHGLSLREALKEDTAYLCDRAEGIVMLPGWEHSNGALAEWHLARALSKLYPFAFLYLMKHGTQYVFSSVDTGVAHAA